MNILFNKHIPNLGHFSLRPFKMPEDIATIHAWVSREYAAYWGLVGKSLNEVEAAYQEICQNTDVYLGFYNQQPAFLLEHYDPKDHGIDAYYDWQTGDHGMHILVAPPNGQKITDFTWSIFTVIVDFIFSLPNAQRIVVEPDIRNEKIHPLNKRAGFVYQKIIELPHKTAHLAFCTPADYQTALKQDYHTMTQTVSTTPELAVQHLQPKLWAKINRLHLCKAISEFAHELLIQPELQSMEGDWGCYQLKTDIATVEYHFRARLLSLEHWVIEPQSLEKWQEGQLVALDSLRFILEIRQTLGISDTVLPVYMEEINSTLYGSAYKHSKQGVNVADLVRAKDFQLLETSMMEGHPAFLANNGRIGFDAVDYRRYAPEAAQPVQLIWLAVHKSKAEFACADDLSYALLMEQELGAAKLAQFQQTLQQSGLQLEDYWLMPTHPWQWFNKLAVVFAADIATLNIVCLGYGEDLYQAQQSIRTFFNLSHNSKFYVKTALSILNMGFMRGLSPYYMSTTPAINDCIHGLIEQDPYLAGQGFSILREIAAIGYRHTDYEAALGKQDSPYKKMLAALWRETPIPQLKTGQQLMTMAGLLHIDAQGTALLPELIKASGLQTTQWLQRYLNSYLSPLLHCFYAYDLVFMPHGENVILVLENHLPVRAIMKDIAEESIIMNEKLVLSEKVQRIAIYVPEELKILALLIDVFDSFFRYLAQILVIHADYEEARFWQLVAECVLEYQQQHVELADKFARYDLFAPEFARSCLNRLQLNNNQQMVNLAEPAKDLQFFGTLKNPIACFKQRDVLTEELETYV
jgi:siderophore synthetase component